MGGLARFPISLFYTKQNNRAKEVLQVQLFLNMAVNSPRHLIFYYAVDASETNSMLYGSLHTRGVQFFHINGGGVYLSVRKPHPPPLKDFSRSKPKQCKRFLARVKIIKEHVTTECLSGEYLFCHLSGFFS
jgi:hypothetical protein